MKEMIEYIPWICLSLLALVSVYLVSAILFAHSGLNTFYIALRADRFAFRTTGSDPIGVIYNSDTMKLVNYAGHPMGRFVERVAGDNDDELQKLGPVEKLLGIRFIGIPFIHSLLVKDMSWVSVEGTSFTERKNVPVCEFAINKTFGFNLKNLVLGRDSDHDDPAIKKGKDDDKLERILVNIFMMLQGTIRNPYLAIIDSDWMAGTEGKLIRFVQGFLGRTSQDELIEQKTPPRGPDGKPTYCDLVLEVLTHIDELQTYGVTFEPEKVTYLKYELAGSDENRESVQAANTLLFTKKQEAAGLRETKRAEQEDMVAQLEVIASLVTQLRAQKMTKDQIAEIVRGMLRAKGLAETNVSTLVEGGANSTVAVPAGTGGANKKRGKKDNGKAEEKT